MSLKSTLLDEIRKLPVIDSHEHLPPESEVVARRADIFTRIFCHYSITNAISAGMETPRETLLDTEVPLEKRWAAFRPYYDAIRETGYVRAAEITAAELYGVERIDDGSYNELSDRLQAPNRIGLYDSVLKDRCRIERVINQAGWIDDFSLAVGHDFSPLLNTDAASLLRLYRQFEERTGSTPQSAGAWVERWLSEIEARGVVGLKFPASLPSECVDDAAPLFGKLRSGGLEDGDAAALGAWLVHRAIEGAPEHGLVIAVHCGIIWDCWSDFRLTNPLNMIPLLMKYRKTRFDLYHGGIPWVREMAVIGNQYPNAYLNLVWCHQISPYMTEQMLNEWLDLVPVNKIIGFGGDNCEGPEKTFGALRLAQELIVRALSVRIERGRMSEERALEICRLWFYDNPKRIYGI